MGKLKIVAIVGSLRKESFNRQLAAVAKELVGDKADFEILEYEDVPFMNQDIEFPTPEAVKRVRGKVKSADGIWFFTPEYNHSFSGVLKNLIDWLSRPVSKSEGQVLKGKAAAISGVSPAMAGTVTAQDNLVVLLSVLNMDIMNQPRLAVPSVMNQLDENGKLKLVESKPFLENQVNAFIDFINRRK